VKDDECVDSQAMLDSLLHKDHHLFLLKNMTKSPTNFVSGNDIWMIHIQFINDDPLFDVTVKQLFVDRPF
jgi:hypothetical protein